MKYEDSYDDDHDFDDETGESEEGNGEFQVDDEAIIEAINVDLLQNDKQHRILEQSIKVASGDWFWNFRSETTKLKRISRIYKRMLKIIEKE